MIYSGVQKPKRNEVEFQHQCSLFEWARNPAILKRYPSLDLLSASLNGVRLSKAQAGKAKAAGMLKGEHDIKLPVARGGHIGLSIELKAGRNKPTDEQIRYGNRLTEEGWKVAYHWNWEDARDEILAYLALGDSKVKILERL